MKLMPDFRFSQRWFRPCSLTDCYWFFWKKVMPPFQCRTVILLSWRRGHSKSHRKVSNSLSDNTASDHNRRQALWNSHLPYQFSLFGSGIFNNTAFPKGACYSVSGWVNMVQAGRPRVRFPMRSLIFLIDLLLSAAMCLGGRLSL
jgi:hypothetical protein